jgi:hypothetical protein
MRWSEDHRQTIVWIDRRSLEAHLTAMLGKPPRTPLSFEHGMDTRHRAIKSWRNVVDLLRREIDTHGTMPAEPLVITEFERLLFSQLPLGQPNNYSVALQRIPSAAARSDCPQCGGHHRGAWSRAAHCGRRRRGRRYRRSRLAAVEGDLIRSTGMAVEDDHRCPSSALVALREPGQVDMTTTGMIVEMQRRLTNRTQLFDNTRRSGGFHQPLLRR